uniref:Ionotropic glutamate receptor C-terminal domain-containing protein n=1 Tax=Tetranychus urticae TaxID=32264 RepID=T1KAT4_TETUR
MEPTNLSVGVFTLPFSDGFIEEDGQIVPGLKSLKEIASLTADYGPFNLKFHLPETGQLGVLTETGYHDGVLGLMQEGRPPGRFSQVISEEDYLISSIRNTIDDTSAVVSSLISIYSIPVLVAILAIFILELAAVKYFNIKSLFTVIYKTFVISFNQHLTNRSSLLCFTQMIILMIPLYIFGAAFNTQTIVGNNDVKIETLRDIVDYDKSPFFIEGLSMYDLFAAKVTRDYGDVFEKAKAEGLDQPFELGPIPFMKEEKDKMCTFLSGKSKKLAQIAISSNGFLEANQELYFSERPFHKSLQAILVDFNFFENSNFAKLNKVIIRSFESGITEKNLNEAYIDFLLNFYYLTKFDFYKNRKSNDLSWKSLNWNGFNQICYIFIGSLIFVTVIQLIEIIIVKLIPVLIK